MACHRMIAWCDASVVSLGKSGPAREPEDLYAVHNWTRQGTEGFLGHRRCQGPTSGVTARRHEALILMGGWCGAAEPTPRERKHGCVCKHKQGWSVPSGTQRKKRQKLCEG